MKGSFNMLLDRFVHNFGFDSRYDFKTSFLHMNLMSVTIPTAVISSFLEQYFGMHTITMVAFFILITLELFTGIIASKVRNIPIQSKKFSRFGFKLGIWVSIFFILHTMKLQYVGTSVVAGIYGWLHNGIFIYVTMEYLLSVVENVSVITGDKNNVILSMIKGSVGKYIKIKENEAEEFFQVNDELLSILTPEGNFRKVNKAWIDALGYDEKYILNKSYKDFVHPEDMDITTKKIDEMKATGSMSSLINRYRTKNGNYIYLSWNSKGGSNGLFFCNTKIVI